MTRRGLLAAALSARALLAKSRIDKTRLSVITDVAGPSAPDAIDFARHYGLRWVELRNIPGSNPPKEYALQREAEVKQAAAALAGAGLLVSFLYTTLLKFDWAKDRQRWDARKDDLQRACTAANILGCDKIGIFTGNRTANAPVAETIAPLAELAATFHIHLLVSNDPAQNISTAQELSALNLDCNWTPQPGDTTPPRERLLNVQFAFTAGIDWSAIIKALDKDGYKYQLGLNAADAEDSLRNMLRIVD